MDTNKDKLDLLDFIDSLEDDTDDRLLLDDSDLQYFKESEPWKQGQ